MEGWGATTWYGRKWDHAVWFQILHVRLIIVTLSIAHQSDFLRLESRPCLAESFRTGYNSFFLFTWYLLHNFALVSALSYLDVLTGLVTFHNYTISWINFMYDQVICLFSLDLSFIEKTPFWQDINTFVPYLKWTNMSGILTSKNPLKTIQNTAFLSSFILIIIPQKMCIQALGVHRVYGVYWFSLLKTCRLPAQWAPPLEVFWPSPFQAEKMLFLFCYRQGSKKAEKTPKKKLPDNNLKVSVPTVFTSLEFLKTQTSFRSFFND